MKQGAYLTRRFLLIVAMATACDSFQEDYISPERQFVVNPAATDYFILSNAAVVIDLKTMLSDVFAEVSIAVSEPPARGRLVALSDVLLKYVPSVSFVQGTDEFELTFRSHAKVFKQIITITLVQRSSDLPCVIYAVEDYSHTSRGKPVSIKNLSNDLTCGIRLTDVDAVISVPPQYGQATLQGDSIIYSPDSDFVGLDEIVYKISHANTAGPDSLLVSYGVVQISVSDESCPFFLLNSYTLNLTDDVADELNSGDCVGGYNIPIWGITTPPCDQYGYYARQISQSRESGNVCYGRDGGFAYYPDPGKVPKNDNAEFEVCINAHCQRVSIYIIRE